MQARLPDDNTMNVTVSVRVDKTMVPVIGMSLKRVDDTASRRHRPAVTAPATFNASDAGRLSRLVVSSSWAVALQAAAACGHPMPGGCL